MPCNTNYSNHADPSESTSTAIDSNTIAFHDEPTVFEQSKKNRHSNYTTDNTDYDLNTHYKSLARQLPAELPELCETDIVRHYTRLSRQNYSKDLGLYPLGSCTMKHNPRLANKVANLNQFTQTHPYLPDHLVQGNLALCHELEELLSEISGMANITLWPAAGSHGEFTGMLMIRAYHLDQGSPRKTVLIPDSAHGTNPSSAAICGYDVQTIPSNAQGLIDADSVAKAMTKDVAAIMITNPNTLGLFESEFKEIADIVHQKGGLVYLDGANLNALMGYVKPGHIGADIMHFNLHKTFATPHGGGGPGAGPVGVVEKLAPYLPTPRIIKKNNIYSRAINFPNSIGPINTFFGNFGVLVRAYTYIRALGADGLKEATEMAVLNANYIYAMLKNHYHCPFPGKVLHECVFNDKYQNEHGIKTLDIAKRLIDFGFHPPTIYFPLIVSGALMIEPTETENKDQLDEFCNAMIAIATESKHNAELLRTAPTRSFRRRLNEVKAAKDMTLRD